jgi:hypothetical protein
VYSQETIYFRRNEFASRFGDESSSSGEKDFEEVLALLRTPKSNVGS